MTTPSMQALCDTVHMIPRGRVTSYGRVAQLLDIYHGIHLSGFFVGKMLSSLSPSLQMLVPWWRVVNKQGYISAMKLGARGVLQRDLLMKEGVEVVGDCVDMKKYERGKEHQ